MRSLAATWILGGILLGVGALEFLWHPHLTSPFTWLCIAGGLLLLVAVIWTAAVTLRLGSRLAFVGLPVFFVGFLTLFFGIGVLGLLGGLALYVLGIDRAGVVDRQALIYAVMLLALAFPAAIALHSPLAGTEVAVASACVTGLGVIRARPAVFHGSEEA